MNYWQGDWCNLFTCHDGYTHTHKIHTQTQTGKTANWVRHWRQRETWVYHFYHFTWTFHYLGFSLLFHGTASGGDRCPSAPPSLSPDNPPRADRSLEGDHTNPTESHYPYPDAAGRTSAASPVTAFLHFKSLLDTALLSLGVAFLLFVPHWH